MIAVTAIACLGYFSFLFPFLFESNQFQLTPEVVSLACLRSAFYAIVAFVVFEEAQAKRNEVKRTQEVVAQLRTSNRNLRRAETSLRRSERLAALGQLTAGLAHELRNPLGTIRASSEMLTKDTAKNNPEVMAEMASFVRSEADRMNSLIGSFLDLCTAASNSSCYGRFAFGGGRCACANRVNGPKVVASSFVSKHRTGASCDSH